MLHRVANYYRRQLDDSLKSLTALVEPAMMVIIGGVVFVFVLGVFLPIMGIVSALSGGAH
jgi:type II secretory pathway component PulF